MVWILFTEEINPLLGYLDPKEFAKIFSSVTYLYIISCVLKQYILLHDFSPWIQLTLRNTPFYICKRENSRSLEVERKIKEKGKQKD